MMKRFFIIATLLLVYLTAGAQPCRNFHYERDCNIEKDNFKQYGQSKSAMMEVDSSSSYPVIFYGNKDYVVTVCTEQGYYPIHLKLINSETGNVLYDNLNDDYYESIGFTVDKTQKIIIEIKLLAEGLKQKDFGDNNACVGVYIQWRKAVRLGF